MTRPQYRGLGLLMALSALIGVAAALVIVGVFVLFGWDVGSGVVGAVSGGVAGTVVPVVVLRRTGR